MHLALALQDQPRGRPLGTERGCAWRGWEQGVGAQQVLTHREGEVREQVRGKGAGRAPGEGFSGLSQAARCSHPVPLPVTPAQALGSSPE